MEELIAIRRSEEGQRSAEWPNLDNPEGKPKSFDKSFGDSFDDLISIKPILKGRLTTLLLNLPFKEKVMRRYMCSYNAPNLLFPPQELIALGGIVKEWKKDKVEL